MWHLTKIPKVLHVYYGGTPLSYLRYLTIKTFNRFNPDWLIKIHVPKFPHVPQSWGSFEQKYKLNLSKDYFSEIKNIPNTKILYWDFDRLGLNNKMSEVHKSDFLRWLLLGTEGGLWSDMDIIYFKSINQLEFNSPLNTHIDTCVSIYSYGHSIGFMLSSANNPYFTTLWKKAAENFNSDNYQSIGSILCNRYFPSIERIKNELPTSNPINIPMSTVYPYHAGQIKEIFAPGNLGRYTKDSIGLHWYAGHPLAGEYLNKYNGGESLIDDSVVTKTAKVALSPSFVQHLNQSGSRTDSVLDLGCGNKKLSQALTRHCDKTTTVDIWKKFNPDVIWDLNNIPLPFKNDSFDTVLLIDLIEHLQKPKGMQLLAEAKRITRQNIFLLTPLWWDENLGYMNDPNSDYYQNTYDKHQSLWTKADFSDWKEIKEVTFLGHYFFGEWRKNG